MGRAADRAGQAGIDEPVNHAEPQATLEAAAAAERAEVEDADIEI